MSEQEIDGVLLATITIRRVATTDDVLDQVIAVDAYDEPIGLAEALGMLRLAEHTLIDDRMYGDEEDDE